MFQSTDGAMGPSKTGGKRELSRAVAKIVFIGLGHALPT